MQLYVLPSACCYLTGIKSVFVWFSKGVRAIHSPHTGIVDWAEVARSYGEEFKRSGGDIKLNFEVTRAFRWSLVQGLSKYLHSTEKYYRL